MRATANKNSVSGVSSCAAAEKNSLANCVVTGRLGQWQIVASKGRIIGLEPASANIPADKKAQDKDTADALQLARNWLDAYMDFRNPDPGELPIQMRGTDFQIAVWKILMLCAYGQTISYSDLAKMYAEKNGLTRMSPRAIGNAVGANPLAIVIPCHRVILSSGHLGGFGWGTELKRKLLLHEGVSRFA